MPQLLPGLSATDPLPVEDLQRALAALGPGYQPRTEHLLADGQPRYSNRLLLQSSPYLLQHAHNPVNWYPWGEEAFQKARETERPILLSIGYSTCHWCHVMERESFEDEEVATFINQHFVAVKVDREERPDVDDVYMAAVQVFTGGGGWPLTAFLTADGAPFFAGTYFPARDGDRGAHMGFLTLLERISTAWTQQRTDLVSQALALAEAVKKRSQPPVGGDLPGLAAIDAAVAGLRGNYDARWGGFGTAPKFPQPSHLLLLLRHAHRTGDPQSLDMAVHTLRQMASGGLHDQVGGGFHRYSTDSRWLVPHFEKMLYDNALLASAYLEGWQATGGAEDLQAVMRSTLDYVEREMTHEQGGFFSATDADSPTPSGESEEGWFFTWTVDEVGSLLSAEDAAVFTERHGLTREGNFEGRNILYAARSIAQVAAARQLTVQQVEASLDRASDILLQARLQRPAPLRDEKVLTAWNGLMISAFARAGAALSEPGYVAVASRAAEFVLSALRTPDGQLLRSWKDGSAHLPAYLDDYAFFIQGLLDLYEADPEPRWLATALALQAVQDERFSHPKGGWYLTSAQHEALLTRPRPDYDGAIPAGNSVGLHNLLRLAALRADASLHERAERGLAAFSQPLTRWGASLSHMLVALDAALEDAPEVIIVGAQGDPARDALAAVVQRVLLPNGFTLVLTPAQVRANQALVPALEGRALDGPALAYVCHRGVCLAPTRDPQALRGMLTPP